MTAAAVEMMTTRRFLLLGVILGLFASAASAATSIRIWTLQGTNGTWYTNNVTVSGKFIRYTNALTSSTAVTNTSPAGSITNLYSQLGSSPILGVTATMTNTNTIVFRGDALVVSVSPGWASLTAVTNASTNIWDYALPIENLAGGATTWTNNSSNAVYSFKYSSAKFGNAWPAMDDFVGVGSSYSGGTQAVTAPKFFNRLGGTNEQGIFGGVYWSPRLASPYVTNLTNFGLAISSPGSGTRSEQFGSGAIANMDDALAVGRNAKATNLSAMAVGLNSLAGQEDSMAIGNGASATYPVAMAVGEAASASGSSSMALGNSTVASNHYSSAIGYSARTTRDNQIVLGIAGQSVTIPGWLEFLFQTNSTLGGTNVNRGDWSDPIYQLTTLANGNNLAVPLTNVNVAVSGPSAAFAICGIYGGRDGRVIHVFNASGQSCTVAHDSGVDPTPANRIWVTPNADQAFPSGSWLPALKWNAQSNRWTMSLPISASTNAAITVKTGAVTVASSATCLNVLTGGNGNLSVRATNTAGLVDLEIRDTAIGSSSGLGTNTTFYGAIANTGTSTNTGAINNAAAVTNWSTSLLNGAAETRSTVTNAGAVNNGAAVTNWAGQNTRMASATAVGNVTKMASSATTNAVEFQLPDGYPAFGFNSNGIPFLSISNSSVQYPLVGRVFSQVGRSTCTNISTVETTWLGTGQGSLTLPANFWAVGRALQIDARGYIWTGTANNSAFYLKLGSQVVATNWPMSLPNSMVADCFDLKATMTCWTNSASVGYIQCDGEMRLLSTTGGTITHTKYFKSNVPIFDTTASAAINLTSTNGATTTGIQVNQVMVTLLP